MADNNKAKVTVEVEIHAPIKKVWEMWTKPEHIVKWNSASEDWHSPKAENDVREGGKFNIRMESKDGKEGFDFSGTYDEVAVEDFISYTMDDGRRVDVSFEDDGDKTHVTETFEAEDDNSIEVQKGGWQAILNNFKKYVESNK